MMEKMMDQFFREHDYCRKSGDDEEHDGQNDGKDDKRRLIYDERLIHGSNDELDAPRRR